MEEYLRRFYNQPINISTENKIMSYVSKTDNIKLFDFGAGFGRYLNMFSKYILKTNLYGAEIDEDGFKYLQEQGFNVYKPDYNKPEIPYEDGYFDYIFTSNVLEHIPNKYYKAYLKEFYRVLKVDGILLFGAPNYPIKRLYDIKKAFDNRKKGFFKYYFFDDPTHCNKLSIYDYEKDFNEFFNEVRLEPTYIFFEDKLRIIKNNRYKLRILSNKIFGYCGGKK